MFARQFKVIGAKVRYYRTLKGMTQLQLADAIAMSEDYVSKIERGVAFGVTIATGLRIAEALDVEFAKLTKED